MTIKMEINGSIGVPNDHIEDDVCKVKKRCKKYFNWPIDFYVKVNEEKNKCVYIYMIKNNRIYFPWQYIHLKLL